MGSVDVHRLDKFSVRDCNFDLLNAAGELVQIFLDEPERRSFENLAQLLFREVRGLAFRPAWVAQGPHERGTGEPLPDSLRSFAPGLVTVKEDR